MWNMFQNDVPSQMKNSHLYLYADDRQIYAMGKQIRNVENILRNEMEIASTWYEENLLKSNYQKYQTMTIKPNEWANANEDIVFVSIDDS